MKLTRREIITTALAGLFRRKLPKIEPVRRFLLKSPRFSIPFYTVTSERFVGTFVERAAYEMPITKILEANSMKDITYSEDEKMWKEVVVRTAPMAE